MTLSVVTYNNEEYIGDMLDSQREHVKGAPYHVYVIENGSKDTMLSNRAWYDGVRSGAYTEYCEKS